MTETQTLAVVVNGRPCAGKDTFVDFCIETLTASGVSAGKASSVDKVKDAARILGWDGVKDDRGRMFLSDLKDLSGAVYGGPMAYMIERLGGQADVMFFHIREPEEIASFLEKSGGISVLIDRPSQESLFSNHADQRTHLADYTYTIFNHLDLPYLRSTAIAFCSKLARDYLGKPCALTKTAADYTPLSPYEVKEIVESVAPAVDEYLCSRCQYPNCNVAPSHRHITRCSFFTKDAAIPPPPSDEWETKDLCRRCGNVTSDDCPNRKKAAGTVVLECGDFSPEDAPAPLSLSLPSITVEGDLEEVRKKYQEEFDEWLAADSGTLHSFIEAWDVIQVRQTFAERGGDVRELWDEVSDRIQGYHRDNPDLLATALRATLMKNAARFYYSPEVNTRIILSGGREW